MIARYHMRDVKDLEPVLWFTASEFYGAVALSFVLGAFGMFTLFVALSSGVQ